MINFSFIKLICKIFIMNLRILKTLGGVSYEINNGSFKRG
jgi:hypothetical protein